MFNRHLPHWPEGAPHHLTLPDTSLFCNLEISARRYPQKTAIIYYDTLITYAQLLDEVERLAGYFQSQGVKRGDRVLLFMQTRRSSSSPTTPRCAPMPWWYRSTP